MKLRYLFFLLVLLQLTSCSKRYGYLKKIRVANNTTLPNTVKAPGPAQKNSITETASIDSGFLNILDLPIVAFADTLKDDHQHEVEQQSLVKPSTKSTSLFITKTKPLPADSSIHQSEGRRWNKNALIASGLFIASVLTGLLLAGALGGLISSVPIVAIALLAAIGGIIFSYARKGWREMKLSNERGRGIAFIAMVLGALAVFSLVTFFPAVLLSFSAKTVQSFYVVWVLLTVLITAIAVYFEVHQKKVKPHTEEKAAPEKPKLIPGPDNYNKPAVIAFISAIIFALAALGLYFIGGALFGVLLFIAPVLALLFGIIAFRTIRETHQKGKWMSWVGMLAVPLVLLGSIIVMSPVLGLLALLIWGIIWLVKRKKNRN